MLAQLLAPLKPQLKAFHPSRMLLGAMAFALPLGVLLWLGQPMQAGMLGFAVFYTLISDIGHRRRVRLESMLLGNLAILAAATLSMSLNEHWGWWLSGIVVLISLIGANMAAGFTLDITLRSMASAYLVGYPGSFITADFLPMYVLGAVLTMALSMAFAPRMNNPLNLVKPPNWRREYHSLRKGERAGLSFGILLAFACTFSFFIAHQAGLSVPSIAAITTLMVFKPEHAQTMTNIWLRIVGVLLASLLAWWLIFPLHNLWLLLALISLVAALLPIAFANGLMYIAAVSTLLIYILLAFFGLHGQLAKQAAENRLLETLLGVLVAAIFAMIFQSLKPANPPEAPF